MVANMLPTLQNASHNQCLPPSPAGSVDRTHPVRPCNTKLSSQLRLASVTQRFPPASCFSVVLRAWPM